MSINLDDILKIIYDVNKMKLDKNQRKVVERTEGPLWVIAGPGSGKSEVLIVRTLNLLYVKNVNPKSIIITTFTKKASRNLLDRILEYSRLIVEKYPELKTTDVNSLRIGTLHELCNEIMLEYKYIGYENYRLINDIEQYLFTYNHLPIIKSTANNEYRKVWDEFKSIFSNSNYKIEKTGNVIKLFNRIVEDMLDLNLMEKENEGFKILVEEYRKYTELLEEHKICDFAHLQKKFLEFLDSPVGKNFLTGRGITNPGIKYVMVDEYQDTNPIQEEIYFKLSKNTKNLCVVGDDDQALYRFRGGTVDCMVNFDKACERNFGITLSEENKIFLNSNYRSHEKIVGYCNDYITSFESMKKEGARVSNEHKKLKAEKEISGEYPVLSYISGETIEKTAEKFADCVKYFLDEEIINDPSQCVLLMNSVKESKPNALYFAEKLRQKGISVYNPRSKKYLEQEEIATALGAFISIVDPELTMLNSIKSKGIRDYVNKCIEKYNEISKKYKKLKDYVNKSVENISKLDINKKINSSIMDILYHILANEPFNQWKEDEERSYRLGILTQIFNSYSSIPYPDKPGSNRGILWISSQNPGQISNGWVRNFYYSLIGILTSQGLDDYEDEEIIVPEGKFPIMTIHQAKGLEFPVVFVYGLKNKKQVDSSIKLEEKLYKFRKNKPITKLSSDEKSEQDTIRRYYVAYSRAQYALIHLVPKTHFKTHSNNGDGYVGFIGKSVSKFLDYMPCLDNGQKPLTKWIR